MNEQESGNLGKLITEPKSGEEPLHSNGRALGRTIRDFWRWSASDLVSNATRGILAEFIVASALAVSTNGVRDEWGAFDLETAEGVKIEVKSSAYVQSWAQSKLSEISFRTPKTHYVDPNTNHVDPEAKRQADIYVFAVLAHKEQSTIDPLNVDQWEFYVVQTADLDGRTRSQYGITLPTLKRFCTPVCYSELRAEVTRLIGPKQKLSSESA